MLSEAGVPSPDADATALLAHAWDLEAGALARRRLFAEAVPAVVAARFAHVIDARSRRIPLQHLTGIAHFRRLSLRVGPGVFVPRPETELLVTEVLDHLDRLAADERAADSSPDSSAGSSAGSTAAAGSGGGSRAPLVVDLCSGSGAIALSVALERPGTQVIGIEREARALDWSRSNLADIDLAPSRVDFLAGDATSVAADHPELCGQVDAVVSNPPYVPDAAVPREPEVRDHDPAAALYGGATGLEVPALIVAEAARLLRPGGLLVIEHAEAQGRGMREIIAATPGLGPATTSADYTGRDRYTAAVREAAPARRQSSETENQ